MLDLISQLFEVIQTIAFHVLRGFFYSLGKIIMRIRQKPEKTKPYNKKVLNLVQLIKKAI